jgi:hypothetical protein
MTKKKQISISIYIATLILTCVFTEIVHSQSTKAILDIDTYFKEKSERANPIFKKLDSYGLNEYPFDNVRALVGCSDLLDISEKIVLLHESSGNKIELLENMITDIQIAFLNRNTKNPYAVMNYQAFAQKLPNTDVDLLFASFVLCNQKKVVNNIETLLEYSTIFIGPGEIAEPGISSSIRIPKKISEEQRLKHWPAANAILSNPTKSKPLLIQVIKNSKIKQHIRLRAAAFLNQISPDSIKDILPGIEDAIAKQITCIQQDNLSWKYAIPNVCERIKWGKKRMENILKRSKRNH